MFQFDRRLQEKYNEVENNNGSDDPKESEEMISTASITTK